MQKLADISLFESLSDTGCSQNSVFNRSYPTFDNLGFLDKLFSYIGLGKKQRLKRKGERYKKLISGLKKRWDNQGGKSKWHDVPYEPAILQSARLLDEEFAKGNITEDQYNQLLANIVETNAAYHPEFYGGRYDDAKMQYKEEYPPRLFRMGYARPAALNYPGMIEVIDPETGEVNAEELDRLHRLARVNAIMPVSYPVSEEEMRTLEDWVDEHRKHKGVAEEYINPRTGNAVYQYIPEDRDEDDDWDDWDDDGNYWDDED